MSKPLFFSKAGNFSISDEDCPRRDPAKNDLINNPAASANRRFGGVCCSHKELYSEFNTFLTAPRGGVLNPSTIIKCELCPKRCAVPAGGSGQCKVRINKAGNPEIPFYGFVTAMALDPIEKKPLYHFRPGSNILSIGFSGCNLKCPFCQNWHISQTVNSPGRYYSPAEIVAAARSHASMSGAGSQSSIAYTYSEPLVHIEFLLDCMKEARKNGTANVLVTNGCVNRDAAFEILEFCDAVNVDLKCFSQRTYAEILGGDLSSVLNFIRMAVEKDVHTEITTLLVTGLNDSAGELNKCRDFIAELSANKREIPWHISACHPAWKWDIPAADSSFLIETVKHHREKLRYVYPGNISVSENNFNDTVCPYCGKTLVSRSGYRIDTSGIAFQGKGKNMYGVCAACGKPAPVRY